MMFPTQTGYDRAITVFSPEGKLYQVDYAEKAVNRAPPAIGIKVKDGIVLLAEKKVTRLMEPDSIEKIFVIDEHIGAVMCGLYGDARVLISRAREEAQANRLSFGESISTLLLTKRLCDYIQLFTQNAGVRPFGVILIIGGVDEDSSLNLYITHPSGAFYGYKAVAVGERSDSIKEFLEEKYNPNLSIDETISLGIKCLKIEKKEKLKLGTIEIGVIYRKEKKFKKFTPEEVSGLLKKLKVE